MRDAQVVIAGAGPSGMLLAYLLAGNGARVRVLERHADFRREFRGEGVQPMMKGALEQLGLLEMLREQGAAREVPYWDQYVGRRRVMRVADVDRGGFAIQQTAFLELLHAQCSRFPGYRLDLDSPVQGLFREGGRVTGVTVRGERVAGDVFVVCNGRHSALRAEAGLEAQSFAAPFNVLWLKLDFSDAPDLLPKGLEVYMLGSGDLVVQYGAAGAKLQIAYSQRGELNALLKDPAALRRQLLPKMAPRLREAVDARLDKAEKQILKVTIDRLRRWHAPGVLFLGDAAHTMSPVGAQGLNLAMRDSIVAANHFLDALEADRVPDERDFAAVEAERLPEIELAQSFQLRIGRMVAAPLPVQHVAMTVIAALTKLLGMGRKLTEGVTQVPLRYPVTAEASAPIRAPAAQAR